MFIESCHYQGIAKHLLDSHSKPIAKKIMKLKSSLSSVKYKVTNVSLISI